MRLRLQEVRGRHGGPPDLFVERPVQADWRTRFNGRYGPTAVWRLEREIGCDAGAGEQQRTGKHPKRKSMAHPPFSLSNVYSTEPFG
jgi:hypothetical protein